MPGGLSESDHMAVCLAENDSDSSIFRSIRHQTALLPSTESNLAMEHLMEQTCALGASTTRAGAWRGVCPRGLVPMGAGADGSWCLRVLVLRGYDSYRGQCPKR